MIGWWHVSSAPENRRRHFSTRRNNLCRFWSQILLRRSRFWLRFRFWILMVSLSYIYSNYSSPRCTNREYIMFIRRCFVSRGSTYYAVRFFMLIFIASVISLTYIWEPSSTIKWTWTILLSAVVVLGHHQQATFRFRCPKFHHGEWWGRVSVHCLQHIFNLRSLLAYQKQIFSLSSILNFPTFKKILTSLHSEDWKTTSVRIKWLKFCANTFPNVF